MHQTFKIALAALLLAGTTLTAEAGRLQGPSTSPARGIDSITTGEIDSPGDPFSIPGGPRGKDDRDHNNPVAGGSLPKSTKEIICRVGEARNGVSYVSLINDTGAVIPAGATIIVYIQPGNIEKQVVVETDWPPGKKHDVILKGMSVGKNAECAVQLKLETTEPPAKKFVTDLTTNLESFHESPTTPIAGCLVNPALNKVWLYNIGPVDWPPGTKVAVTLPNGQVWEATMSSGMHSSALYEIPWDLLFHPHGVPALGEYLPADWTCSIELTFP